MKLLELCKTRAKKSCPDTFNFYVDLVGHDMVTDTGKATTCGYKFKAPSLQTKSTKNDGHFENTGCNGKQFEDFRRNKNYSILAQTTPPNTRPLKTAIDDGTRYQEEINCRKFEKRIQVGTVGTLQD